MTSRVNLKNTFLFTQNIASSKQPIKPGSGTTLSEVYIKSYQDFSEKYGVGYVLTNGKTGFFFNDITNLLWIEQKNLYALTKFAIKGGETTYVSQFTNSKDILKKLNLLEQYKSNLGILSDEDPSEDVMVRKFAKTKNGLLFRLTNSIIQMIFIDKSSIILCLKTKMLIYINNKGIKEEIEMVNETIMTAGENVMKRYKYTLSVLSLIASQKK